MPSISTAFLQALGSATGSASRTIVTPAPCRRLAAQIGAVAVSIKTFLFTLPSVSSAAPSSSVGAKVTALPSQASVRSGTLRRSM